MRVHAFAALTTTLCLALAAAPAVAHHVSVDFGPNFGTPDADGDDFGSDTTCTAGSSTPESCAMTLLMDASSVEIPLGFTIDFGTGPVSSLWTNENGIVTFAAPIVTSSFSSLAAVGQPVIAPFFANLTSVTFVGTVFEMNGQNFGQLMYQRGSASALPGADGFFDQADEVPAFAMMWYGPTVGSSLQKIFAQVIIYSHAASAANDFDIRFRYGFADTDQYNTGPGNSGIAGLLLGTNTLTITGPLSATTDYFYSFRGGKLIGTTPPPPLTLTCPIATAQVGDCLQLGIGRCRRRCALYFLDDDRQPAGWAQSEQRHRCTLRHPKHGGSGYFHRASRRCLGSRGRHCHHCLHHHGESRRLAIERDSRQRVFRHRQALQPRGQDRDAEEYGRECSVAREAVDHAGRGRRSLHVCAGQPVRRSLAAGKSCPIYVVLFGDVLGSPSATLHIPNNAGGSPQTVPVSATITH